MEDYPELLEALALLLLMIGELRVAFLGLVFFKHRLEKSVVIQGATFNMVTTVAKKRGRV